MKKISTKQIKKSMPKIIELMQEIDVVVGISRRGLIPASIIAIHFDKPLEWISIEEGIIKAGFLPQRHTNYLFVDDIIAEGRTKIAVFKKFKNYNVTYLAIVKDSKCTHACYCLFEETEWCYFDWEDKKKVQEKDRGLFRFRSSAYGKTECNNTNSKQD